MPARILGLILDSRLAASYRGGMADFYQRETNGILRLILIVLIAQFATMIVVCALMAKQYFDEQQRMETFVRVMVELWRPAQQVPAKKR